MQYFQQIILKFMFLQVLEILLWSIYKIVVYHSALAYGRNTPNQHEGVMRLNEKHFFCGDNFFKFFQNFLKSSFVISQPTSKLSLHKILKTFPKNPR